ncbi:FAS1-like dehydratase domain-containing protein [Marinovum sp.]|uniref:FAS1-like dehydratase domain-containing protein n=1 Tax=Marinovum sp. TaxID=2024839 RepID=UPI002B2687AD|nr:MaoC family dehydratase N-terminal domain-containing protein [Marinovum sp.]
MDIAHLQSWIGREACDSERLSARKVAEFNATFDRSSGLAEGDAAPLLIHLSLAQPVAPMAALGRDGHPALGGFLPPVPLPRRMWAGGAFTFHAPIRIGETVRRHSVIADVALKQGRSGALCFVTVEHEISAGGRRVVSERQDLVYRDVARGGPPGGAGAPAEQGGHGRRVVPHPTLLFRYSALTFNGHRIHYDRQFCTKTEGYPGLVVHGPLQATLLCQMAEEIAGRAPARFAFRSLSPLFDDAAFSLHAQEDGEALRLWTARDGGPVAMKAEACW